MYAPKKVCFIVCARSIVVSSDWLCQRLYGSTVRQEVRAGATYQCFFRIPLVKRGNRFIAAAVTVWPLTNLMWHRGGGWGERAKAEGRERRHTQKSRDERWREEKATSLHQDGHKQLALSVIALYLAGKIKFSYCGRHFIQGKMMSVKISDVILTTEPPQPGRRSERMTDFHKCALLQVWMWTDCAWKTRTLHSVHLHRAKLHPTFDITASFSATLAAQLWALENGRHIGVKIAPLKCSYS